MFKDPTKYDAKVAEPSKNVLTADDIAKIALANGHIIYEGIGAYWQGRFAVCLDDMFSTSYETYVMWCKQGVFKLPRDKGKTIIEANITKPIPTHICLGGRPHAKNFVLIYGDSNNVKKDTAKEFTNNVKTLGSKKNLFQKLTNLLIG